MREQTKDGDPRWRSNIYLAVGDNRRNEFIVGKAVPSVCGLIAVVEFATELGGTAGVQDAVAGGVLDGPDDSVLRAVCTHAGRRPRVGKNC